METHLIINAKLMDCYNVKQAIIELIANNKIPAEIEVIGDIHVILSSKTLFRTANEGGIDYYPKMIANIDKAVIELMKKRLEFEKIMEDRAQLSNA